MQAQKSIGGRVRKEDARRSNSPTGRLIKQIHEGRNDGVSTKARHSAPYDKIRLHLLDKQRRRVKQCRLACFCAAPQHLDIYIILLGTKLKNDFKQRGKRGKG